MVLAVLNRFLHWMVVGLISPVLVLAIMSKGISLEMVGFIMALLSSFVVVFEVPSGVLSDRIGRKRIYLISLAIFALSFTVLLFSTGFAPVAIGCCLFGLARAFSSGSIESDFIDIYIAKHGKEKLHRIISGINVGEILGLAVGALAGGYLPGLWREIFPEGNMYNGNLAMMLAIVGIIFIVTAFAHTAGTKPTHDKLDVFLKEILSLLKTNRIIAPLSAGIMTAGFAIGSIELYWQPQLKGILGDDRDIWIFGWMNGGYFLAALLGTAAANRFLSRTGTSKLPAIGVLKILMGLTLAFLSFQSRLFGFSALFLLIMGFNGMANIPESVVLNTEIPESKRASLLSLASLAAQTGGIIASAIFSLLKSFLPIGTIWIIAGTIFGASSLIYFRLDWKLKGRSVSY